MFCSHCGNEVSDEAVVCVHCGCALKPQKLKKGSNQSSVSTLKTVAKVFMIISIISCVVLFLFAGSSYGLYVENVYTPIRFMYLIPLAWCIPMFCNYSSKTKKGEPISIGFKVCTLIFFSFIAGILLLCDKEDY